MKRRHESSVENVPSPEPEGTENGPRQIFKKRRTLNNENWVRLGRRRSLRDINNLSEHPASIPHDEKTVLKVAQSKTYRGSPTGSVKEVTPTPNKSSPELNIPLEGSHSEHLPTSTNSRPGPSSVPDQQVSISGPVPSPGGSRSSPSLSPPRFVSHDRPVRITQSQVLQQAHPSGQGPSLDSDQEDESSDEDESDDELGPVTEEADSDEKRRVESNYSEINRLLGDLFLSRHRYRT
ncbi:hypothetical protein OPQ81_010103 [Rhizoctonia solani]|nr:hypothetical protein OPQ81_010103 [Rhizoctonia solani]